MLEIKLNLVPNGDKTRRETLNTITIHNVRNRDTIDQMNAVVCGLVGKRLLYRVLTG